MIGPRLQRSGRLGLLALVALAAAIPSWRFLGQASDDIFITYRYADNLAHGLGLVFNPGERVFGVSDPGVAALLGLVSFLTRVPPHILGTLLTWACLVAIAAALLGAGERIGRRPEAFVASLLLAISPYFWACQGAGPVVAIAALLVSATCLRRRPLVAGVLSGLAVWARPDAGLAVLILALLDGFTAPRDVRRTMRFAIAVAVTTAVGLGGVWFAFGTLVPNAVAAKRDFAALAPHFFTATEFWRRARDLFLISIGGQAWAIIIPGIVGLWPLLRQPELSLRLIACYGVISALFYTALQIPFFVWYTLPALLALLCGWCFLLGSALRTLVRRRTHVVGAIVALFALWCLVRAFAASAQWLRDGASGDWRGWAYPVAARWIRYHSPPGAEIAFDEVGMLAYFSERRVLDLVGLVTPETRSFAAAGDPLGAFLMRPTEFVPRHEFDVRGGTRPIVNRPWFAQAYEEAARFDNAALGGSIIVYRRKDPSAIPPPRPPLPRRPLSAAEVP